VIKNDDSSPNLSLSDVIHGHEMYPLLLSMSTNNKPHKYSKLYDRLLTKS